MVRPVFRSKILSIRTPFPNNMIPASLWLLIAVYALFSVFEIPGLAKLRKKKGPPAFRLRPFYEDLFCYVVMLHTSSRWTTGKYAPKKIKKEILKIGRSLGQVGITCVHGEYLSEYKRTCQDKFSLSLFFNKKSLVCNKPGGFSEWREKGLRTGSANAAAPGRGKTGREAGRWKGGRQPGILEHCPR